MFGTPLFLYLMNISFHVLLHVGSWDFYYFSNLCIGHNKVGSRLVGSHDDIVEGGYSEQCLDILVVSHGGQRVPEENENVEFLLADFRPDLLVAAEGSAVQNFHFQACFFSHFAASRSSSHQLVFDKLIFPMNAPFHLSVKAVV